MKKNILVLVLVFCNFCVNAQDSLKVDTSKVIYSNDYNWCFDLNARGGIMNQNTSFINLLNNYLNPVNTTIGNLKGTAGNSFGFDAQIGYFFGEKKNIGVGIGFSYAYQSSYLQLDNIHVEYQSVDQNNTIFRQIISGKDVKELINSSVFSVPLVMKYRTHIKNKIGFTADLGLVNNFMTYTTYNTNASFNYEAIYKYSFETGKPVGIYDNATTPATDDILFTISHSNGNASQHLDSLRTVQGYNVGVAQKPNNSSGNYTSSKGSLGMIFQPQLTYALTDRLSLNGGLFYSLQIVYNNAVANYKITEKVGSYNSLSNAINNNYIHTYGISIGLRYFFGKPIDSDHDGVPNKKDRCPFDSGLVQFNGCPDRDGDGIPDVDDSCPHESGLPKFQGCPDSDGDGIMDKEDSCPHQFGPLKFHGCPDTDGDGIPDKDDSCPRQAGLAQFNGCPDSDGDGIPDNLDECPFVAGPASNNGCPLKDNKAMAKKLYKTVELKELAKKQIYFGFNKHVLKRSSYTYLDSLVKTLKRNPNTKLTIDAYSDNVGSRRANLRISKERALEVRKYMIKRGIEAKRLRTKGHGYEKPIASNRSRQGRAKNRRAMLIVKTKNNYKRQIINNSSAINVYPNEEKGTFTILLKTNFEEDALVTIVNAEGKKVKEFNIKANTPTEFTLDEPAGLYSFTAATASTKYEARIIIAK